MPIEVDSAGPIASGTVFAPDAGLTGREADDSLFDFADEEVVIPEKETAHANQPQQSATQNGGLQESGEPELLDSEEQEETPETSPDEQIQAIIAQYGNDPAKLARQLAHANHKIAMDAAKLAQTTLSAVPTQQAEQELEGFITPNTQLLFDEKINPFDDETGWPLDRNGNAFTPRDSLGIEYVPDTVFRAVQKQLSEKHGTNFLAAQQEFQNFVNRAEQDYQSGYQQIASKFIPAQERPALNLTTEIAADFQVYYPEPVAKKIASRLLELAKDRLEQDKQTGNITQTQAVHKNALANALRRVRGEMSNQHIDEYAKGLPEMKAQAQRQQQQANKMVQGGKPSTTTATPSNNNRKPSGDVDYATPKSFTFE